jgi:hypothetical protein
MKAAHIIGGFGKPQNSGKYGEPKDEVMRWRLSTKVHPPISTISSYEI